VGVLDLDAIDESEDHEVEVEFGILHLTQRAFDI
jgi:hypothetical protein